MRRPNPSTVPTGTSRSTEEPKPHDSAYAQAVAAFCRRQVPAATEVTPRSHPRWQALRAAGSALWLDSGDLDANRSVWTDEFSGLTTNNSLLNDEIQKGLYDDLVPEAAAVLHRADPSLTGDHLVVELAFVLNAVHGLGLARALGADVSVELHTGLAHDTEASHAYGRRLHAICPEHFVVKVPLTPEGLVAARRLADDGVRVNMTLGFSARQNYLIARYARPHFVNVFLGRIDSLLADLGPPAASAGEATTVASQRMLRDLIRHGLAADHTRQIAASIRSGSQIASLAGVDVLTMPVAAARDVASSDLPPGALANRTAADPTEGLAIGEPDDRVDVLWKIEDPVVAAAGQLLLRPIETMTGARLRAVLEDNHLGDLFPALSEAERDRLAAGGKIPRWRDWRGRVGDRTASWDGLLSEAALASFASDQAALDDHIRHCL